jgi:hypothetical protein
MSHDLYESLLHSGRKERNELIDEAIRDGVAPEVIEEILAQIERKEWGERE